MLLNSPKIYSKSGEMESLCYHDFSFKHFRAIMTYLLLLWWGITVARTLEGNYKIRLTVLLSSLWTPLMCLLARR